MYLRKFRILNGSYLFILHYRCSSIVETQRLKYCLFSNAEFVRNTTGFKRLGTKYYFPNSFHCSQIHSIVPTYYSILQYFAKLPSGTLQAKSKFRSVHIYSRSFMLVSFKIPLTVKLKIRFAEHWIVLENIFAIRPLWWRLSYSDFLSLSLTLNVLNSARIKFCVYLISRFFLEKFAKLNMREIFRYKKIAKLNTSLDQLCGYL